MEMIACFSIMVLSIISSYWLVSWRMPSRDCPVLMRTEIFWPRRRVMGSMGVRGFFCWWGGGSFFTGTSSMMRTRPDAIRSL